MSSYFQHQLVIALFLFLQWPLATDPTTWNTQSVCHLTTTMEAPKQQSKAIFLFLWKHFFFFFFCTSNKSMQQGGRLRKPHIHTFLQLWQICCHSCNGPSLAGSSSSHGTARRTSRAGVYSYQTVTVAAFRDTDYHSACDDEPHYLLHYKIPLVIMAILCYIEFVWFNFFFRDKVCLICNWSKHRE